MRINIIGPSCVGKTYLAKKISTVVDWPSIDLDRIFINQKLLKKNKTFVYVSPKEYHKKINQVLDKKNWIIEGVYPVKEVMELADKIVFIKFNLGKSLYWQWRRYLTDSNQRKDYGFWNNVCLSKDIIRQYLSWVTNNIDDPTIFTLRKQEKLTRRYFDKVIRIDNDNDTNDFMSGLSRKI